MKKLEEEEENESLSFLEPCGFTRCSVHRTLTGLPPIELGSPAFAIARAKPGFAGGNLPAVGNTPDQEKGGPSETT